MAIDHAIGLDIGATTTVGAVISRTGYIAARKEIATNSTKGVDDGLRRITKLVTGLIKDAGLTSAQIGGIGIGVAGNSDAMAGRIESPQSLPGWEGMPVIASIRAQFGLPACLLGDSQVAALGEHWLGAAQGARNVFYMAVGKGISGAFIFNGSVYRGLSDNAEVGYQVIDRSAPDCTDVTKGCLEAKASEAAIMSMAAEAPKNSRLVSLAGGDTAKLTTKLVAQAAREGDDFAQSVVQRVGTALGYGIANIVNLLSPDYVVLGGGLMQSWDVFAASAFAVIEQRCQVIPIQRVQIVPARLGANAGITGAAHAIWLHIAGAL
jgi:glucokinase